MVKQRSQAWTPCSLFLAVLDGMLMLAGVLSSLLVVLAVDIHDILGSLEALKSSIFSVCLVIPARSVFDPTSDQNTLPDLVTNR